MMLFSSALASVGRPRVTTLSFWNEKKGNLGIDL